MTKDQVIALEWALGVVSDPNFTSAEFRRAHLADLESLLFESRQTLYAFNHSKTELLAFLDSKGLTIPTAEFDSWRMVIPNSHSFGSILTCRSCGTVIRVSSGPCNLPRNTVARSTSVTLTERPEFCRCGADLAGTPAEPVLADTLLVGQIAGLPESYGTLRATNGILCLIERGDGTIYEGHVQHFEVDPSAGPIRINHDGTAKRAKGSTAKALTRKSKAIEELETFLA